MKKVVLTLSLVAVLGFTGCSKTNTNTNPGAGQQTNETVDYKAQLQEINTAVKEAYGENFLANMEYDTATIEDIFGITPDMYDAVVAQGPNMSAHVDTFVGVHPTAGNKQAVVDALNAYRDNQINNTLQYPMNVMKVQASEVVEKGDYVFFIMLGTTNEAYDSEEAELAAYKELNQVAINVIDGVLNK